MQMRTPTGSENLFASPNLVGLMALHEGNYARMCRLVPHGHPRAYGGVSHVAGEPALHLSVLERCRYTTTYHLTYYFGAPGRPVDLLVPEPDMHIRVYRDARLAEVLHCGGVDRVSMLRGYLPRTGSPTARRWRLNLMLNRWLRYCLDVGHRFPADIVAPA